MKHILRLVAIIISLTAPRAASAQTPASADAARMQWFNDARFGMFIHWGPYAVPAGEYGGRTSHGEWIQLTAKISAADYAKFLPQFNPVKFDARAWVRVAKDAGMKYMVITAKHHDGFAMYDTKLSDYSIVRATPFGRDPLKELAEACREAGLVFCVYYSIPDWHHPDFPAEHGQHGGFHGDPNPNADLEKYVAYMKGQVRELLTNYGPIGILWFDGGGSFRDRTKMPELIHADEIIALVHELQPNCLVNNRLGIPADYTTPEQEIPANGLGVPWETCMTLNGHWGYNKRDDRWKEADVVIHNLVDIASKGGNYLLNVGPTADGEFPPDAVRILGDVGKWMAVNGGSIYGTTPGPWDAPPEWGRVTRKGATLYLHVLTPSADGRISLAGSITSVKAAYALADAKQRPLRHELVGDRLTVDLPADGRDSIDTVIVVETE